MSLERITEILENIESRLARVEKLVSVGKIIQTTSNPKPKSDKDSKTYKGITGGIRYLLENDFFKEPKSMREIIDELKKEGYFYSVPSVDASIRKDFFAKKKMLSRIKSGNIWKYVIRK